MNLNTDSAKTTGEEGGTGNPPPPGVTHVLRLYVTGTTPMSQRAIVNIRNLCEEHLKGRYLLEVIDVSRNATLAACEQIIAIPTLIKKLPLPLRRFIGDMSRTEQLIVGLDIKEHPLPNHESAPPGH